MYEEYFNMINNSCRIVRFRLDRVLKHIVRAFQQCREWRFEMYFGRVGSQKDALFSVGAMLSLRSPNRPTRQSVEPNIALHFCLPHKPLRLSSLRICY